MDWIKDLFLGGLAGFLTYWGLKTIVKDAIKETIREIQKPDPNAWMEEG